MRTYSSSIKSISVVALILLTAPCLVQAALGAEGSSTPDRVLKMLNDARFIRLPLKAESFKLPKSDSLHLPDEAAKHDEGAFRIVDMELYLLSQDPIQVHCEGRPEIRVVRNSDVKKSIEPCRLVAYGYLKTHFPWFFDGKIVKLTTSTLEENGNLFFEWQQPDPDELYFARAYAWIRVVDCKVVGFGAVKRTAPWPNHKMGAVKATEILSIIHI